MLLDSHAHHHRLEPLEPLLQLDAIALTEHLARLELGLQLAMLEGKVFGDEDDPDGQPEGHDDRDDGNELVDQLGVHARDPATKAGSSQVTL